MEPCIRRLCEGRSASDGYMARGCRRHRGRKAPARLSQLPRIGWEQAIGLGHMPSGTPADLFLVCGLLGAGADGRFALETMPNPDRAGRGTCYEEHRAEPPCTPTRTATRTPSPAMMNI